MSTFWKIFITAAVSVVVVGGGTFYVMQRQINNIRSDNQAKIDGLNKQIAGMKSTKSTTTTPSAAATTTPAATTTDWKSYTNAKYNFSLTFNDLWKGYVVATGTNNDTNAIDALYVWTPTTDKTWTTDKAGFWSPVIISVYTPTGWAANQALANEESATLLGHNANYYFGYSQAQANPTDGSKIFADIKTLMATFKLN